MSETPTVLIVDDTPSVRQLVSKLLVAAGYQIAEGGNGKEGLAKFRVLKMMHKNLKLIITDYNMPEMGGIEFITEVRKEDKTTPILMLTTMDAPEKRQEGKMAGANGWVHKPLSPDSFITVVKKMTGM